MKEVVEIQLSTTTEELVKIDLSNQGIIDSDIKELADVLGKYPKKKIFLNLYGNNIGDSGAKEISMLINVINLNLSHNNVRNDGVIALINQPAIRSLDLSDNKGISDSCFETILTFASQEYLVLMGTHVTEENLQKIRERIHQINSKTVTHFRQ